MPSTFGAKAEPKRQTDWTGGDSGTAVFSYTNVNDDNKCKCFYPNGVMTIVNDAAPCQVEWRQAKSFSSIAVRKVEDFNQTFYHKKNFLPQKKQKNFLRRKNY